MFPALFATLARAGASAFARGASAGVARGVMGTAGKLASRLAAKQAPESTPWYQQDVDNGMSPGDVARQFHADARKRFVTPNPTPGQYQQFAREKQEQYDQAQDNGGQKQAEAVGNVIASLTKFAAVGIAARLVLRDWTAGVEQSARQMAMYSTTVADGLAQFERANIRRGVRVAGMTGAGTDALLQAKTRRDDAAVPIVSSLTNLGNAVATKFTDFQTRLLKLLDDMGVDEGFEMIARYLGVPETMEAAGVQRMLHRFLNDLAGGNRPMSPTPEEQAEMWGGR